MKQTAIKLNERIDCTPTVQEIRQCQRLVECGNWPLCGSASQLAATRVAVSGDRPLVKEHM